MYRKIECDHIQIDIDRAVGYPRVVIRDLSTSCHPQKSGPVPEPISLRVQPFVCSAQRYKAIAHAATYPTLLASL